MLVSCVDRERATVLEPHGGAVGEAVFDLGDHEDGDLALHTVGAGDATDRDGRLMHRGQSAISTCVCRTPARIPAAFTTVRIARAVRPPLPLTLPMSSFARRSVRTTPRESGSSVPSTASGSSTISRAMYSRTSASVEPS